jgi:hypothetical protein
VAAGTDVPVLLRARAGDDFGEGTGVDISLPCAGVGFGVGVGRTKKRLSFSPSDSSSSLVPRAWPLTPIAIVIATAIKKTILIFTTFWFSQSALQFPQHSFIHLAAVVENQTLSTEC